MEISNLFALCRLLSEQFLIRGREGNGREGKEITLLVILDECVECNDCQAFLFNLASSLESGELQDEPCAILEKAAGISAL